jgi:hypothetical protein
MADVARSGEGLAAVNAAASRRLHADMLMGWWAGGGLGLVLQLVSAPLVFRRVESGCFFEVCPLSVVRWQLI